MAIHLTPTELAEEVNMKRREVISKCMEMGVPIFNGRIDKTLFLSSLRRLTRPGRSSPRSASRAARARFLAEIAFFARPRLAALDRARRRRRDDGDSDRPGRSGDRSARARSPTCFRSPSREHGGRRAVMYKRTTPRAGPTRRFAEVGEIVRGLSLGLIDLGIEKGDKVSILANTRPEWTYFDFAALTRRRDRGADLPDQLARGVPVRARELRRQGGDRRGRRAARRRSARCATAARSSST